MAFWPWRIFALDPLIIDKLRMRSFLACHDKFGPPLFCSPPPPVHIIISKYVDPRALIFLRPPCMLSTKAEIQKGQGLSFQGLHGGSKYFGGANIMLQATPPGCLSYARDWAQNTACPIPKNCLDHLTPVAALDTVPMGVTPACVMGHVQDWLMPGKS